MSLLLGLCFLLFVFKFSAPFVIVSTTSQPVNSNKFDSSQHHLSKLEAQIAKLQRQLNSHQYHNTYNVPRNCKEIQDEGHNISSIYYIQPTFSSKPFLVLCDMTTRGGGWTYIMNRFDGSEDFYIGWNSYKDGFGNLAGEFWLGLEKIHQLTGYQFVELLVEMVDWDNHEVDAHYNTFAVGSEQEGYFLKALGGFSGSAGDSLKAQAGMRFTTYDKDQDIWWGGNCGTYSKGGWWYRTCNGHSNPTGVYFKQASGDHTGMFWYTYRGNRYSQKQMRMMVRPRRENNVQLSPTGKFLKN